MLTKYLQTYDALKAYDKQVRLSAMLRRNKAAARGPEKEQDPIVDEKQKDDVQ